MLRTNPFRKLYDDPRSIDPWKHGLPDQPLYLDIELTNRCNFSCAFCVRQQMERPVGDMDWGMYREIIKKAKFYKIEGIRLNRWGEPTLYSEFRDAIEMARDAGLMTHVTTNGSRLTEEMCNDIVNAKLDSIIISFQGTNIHTYNSLRGHNYAHVIDGVCRLIEVRGSQEKPFIAVSTTVTDETDDNINTWKEIWKCRDVDETIVNYTWFKRLKNKDKVQDFVEKQRPMPERFKCKEIMRSLAVDWDGTLSPCCLDYDQQLTIGKFPDTDLVDAWLGKEVTAIRELLGNERQDLFKLCSTCQENSGFRGD